jgi:hypothetical protein
MGTSKYADDLYGSPCGGRIQVGESKGSRGSIGIEIRLYAFKHRFSVCAFSGAEGCVPLSYLGGDLGSAGRQIQFLFLEEAKGIVQNLIGGSVFARYRPCYGPVVRVPMKVQCSC